jgi:hypothetical protein
MRITFGRSGVWTTRVGRPQPAPSKQIATNASTVERICRRGLIRLVVARPMRGRLYPLTPSRSSGVPIWSTETFTVALKASWSSGEETIDESDDDCFSKMRPTFARIARTVREARAYRCFVRRYCPVSRTQMRLHRPQLAGTDRGTTVWVSMAWHARESWLDSLPPPVLRRRKESAHEKGESPKGPALKTLVRLVTTERSCGPEDHRPQAAHPHRAPTAKRHPCSGARRQPPPKRSRPKRSRRHRRHQP